MAGVGIDPKGNVWNELDKLDTELSLLTDNVSKCVERLTPIVILDQDEPDESRLTEAPEMSAVAKRINNSFTTATYANNKIKDLLSLLDI